MVVFLQKCYYRGKIAQSSFVEPPVLETAGLGPAPHLGQTRKEDRDKKLKLTKELNLSVCGKYDYPVRQTCDQTQQKLIIRTNCFSLMQNMFLFSPEKYSLHCPLVLL